MKKIVKKGIGIALVYIVAILCTFLISNRVSELDNNSDLRNNNSSISIKFTR
ncbi:MAG: hypothetical protein HFJ12_03050 [Bacilli bacterium]|nr:hypothetical protein [Bacilli bacterium]